MPKPKPTKKVAPVPLRKKVADLRKGAAELEDAQLRAQVDRLVDEIEVSRTHLARERERLEDLLRARRAHSTPAPGVAHRDLAPAPRATALSVGPEDKVERSFAGFLSEIGEAYAQAQAALDRRSAEYLASGSSPLPCVFRIPKLSAEMKFALEKKGDKGMNLIFYSSKSSEKELNQQGISFEIVAAPPPPGLARPAPPELLVGPRWELVAARAERKRLLDAQPKLGQPGLHTTLEVMSADFPSARPRVVLWEALRPAQAQTASGDVLYLAGFCAATNSVSALVFLLITTNDSGTATLTHSVSLSEGSGAASDHLRGFLKDASDWQERQEQLEPV